MPRATHTTDRTTNDTSRPTVAFTLRTRDHKWIAAHDGVTNAAGDTTIQLPADQVETVQFCRMDWLRHDFGKDAPKDAEMALIMSPVLGSRR